MILSCAKNAFSEDKSDVERSYLDIGLNNAGIQPHLGVCGGCYGVIWEVNRDYRAVNLLN
jgi:hypothetical protein